MNNLADLISYIYPSQTMIQNRYSESQHADQQSRLNAAETELIGLNKKLQELTQSYQNEKCQIQYQAQASLQTENCSRLTEVNEVKAAKDSEIKLLNEQNEKNRAVLENKIRCLEDINAKINQEKTAGGNENERLSIKLSFAEATSNTLKNELSSLRSQLQHVSEEKSSTEKSLHEVQLQLSSLEYSNNSQERALSQTEAQRLSAEKISADAKQSLSKQHSEMEELRQRLKEAELEITKYKDLTGRYQTNRLEMKKRIKEKVGMIREQEDVLVAKEKETMELKRRLRGFDEKFQRMQIENGAESRALKDAREQMEHDKKKLENNQQVRHSFVVFLPPSHYFF